jgi:hypothetical protein
VLLAGDTRARPSPQVSDFVAKAKAAPKVSHVAPENRAGVPTSDTEKERWKYSIRDTSSDRASLIRDKDGVFRGPDAREEMARWMERT